MIKLKINEIIIDDNRRKVDNYKVKELAKSIEEIGLLNPITITKDKKLIAGMHRLEAYKILGFSEIKCNIVELNDLKAELAEIDENLIRNELHYIDQSNQLLRRKEIYESLYPKTKKGATNQYTKVLKPESGLSKNLSFVDDVKLKTGKSKSVIKEEVQIAKNIIPEAQKIIKDSDINKTEALKIAKLDPDEQLIVTKKIASGEIKGVKSYKLQIIKNESRQQLSNELEDNRPIVKLESYETWLNTYRNNKADLLLTDPPYSTDIDNIDSFANDWLPKALNCVKDTGMAYVFIGAYPKEVKAYLNVVLPKHINLEQILIWEYKNTLGNNPKDRYKQNYQNILFFKGVNAGDLDCPITNEQWAVQSINAPDGRLGNRFHTWQKPIELAERFIRHSTKQGDIIIDPFVCTGTFVIAANKLGRFGFGCDINKDNLDIAISRGCRLVADCNG